MNHIDRNSESAGTIKRIAKLWRVFRDRSKGRWVQWPYDNFRENELDRYYRTEHWREHQIRRQDIADILTRR